MPMQYLKLDYEATLNTLGIGLKEEARVSNLKFIHASMMYVLIIFMGHQIFIFIITQLVLAH